MQPPSGDVERLAAARDGDVVIDLPAEVPGQHTLWADAEDRAGNVTTAGPFTVTVTCTDAEPVVTGLTAEPVAGSPVSLTLTSVISNTGPDPLPAGIPVVFNEGITHIGSVTTTVPLASGESQALSFVWSPGGTRDYDIAVTVGRIANSPYMPYGPLCVTPPAAHFTVPVRDLGLYENWTLIAPPVNPTNSGVDVVQRGIDGAYAAILGYDGGLLAYHPDRPQRAQTIDATVTGSARSLPDPPTDTLSRRWQLFYGLDPPRISRWPGIRLEPGGYLPRRPGT
jgi:hypothetical protein